MPDNPKTGKDTPDALMADIVTLVQVVDQANEIRCLRVLLMEAAEWVRPEVRNAATASKRSLH